MKPIPVGTHVCAVRQEIVAATKITGTAPVVVDAVGPTTVSEPEPVAFHASIYEYAEVEKILFIGDPSVPGGFITARYLPASAPGAPEPDWKFDVEVVDGAAESAQIVDSLLTITLNTGVSTYATVFATIGGLALIPGRFTGVLDGVGGVVASAQPRRPFRFPPADVVATLTDGGAFAIGEYACRAVGLHAECGVGSVIDVEITDADGGHPRVLLTGVSGAADWHPLDVAAADMLPNQILTVTETVTGVPAPAGTLKYITLYVVNDQRI